MAHVKEDVECHAEEMELTLTEDQVEFAAQCYVYDGDYDCNMTYWDNIEKLINRAVEE